MQIEAIDGKTSLGGWRRGAAFAELLPGVYELRVRRRMAGSGITERLLEGLPGAAASAEAQSIWLEVEADWSYRIFYDWSADSYAVLREPAVLRPRRFADIDAPAAAVRCRPEGESAQRWCRFPAPPGPACHRVVVESAYPGGFDRVELELRARDDASAARAAHRRAEERLAQRRPALAAQAEHQVTEVSRLSNSAPCGEPGEEEREGEGSGDGLHELGIL